MLTWLIDKLLDRLEPRLETLVRAAVDEAVNTAADRIEAEFTEVAKPITAQIAKIISDATDLIPSHLKGLGLF